MAYIDQYGVHYSDDRKTLVRCPKKIRGGYIIPDGVTKIGDRAFECCNGLTSVFIPQSVTHIEYGPLFRKCKNLTSINVSKDNLCYFSIDGVLFEGGIASARDEEEKVLLQYPCGKQGAYTIPDGVTEIESLAFEKCIGLTSVFIPDSVTEIGLYAFSDCTGLTSVTLPHKITCIESGTFSGCSKLKSIIIPDGVTSIGACAFFDCSKLESVTIPDSVTEIGSEAFAWCIQWVVDIPDSVTTIGKRAFAFTYHDVEW